MALGVPALGFTFAMHVLGAASAVLVLVWCVHFRGGLAFEASNKSLIFNVCVLTFRPSLSLDSLLPSVLIHIHSVCFPVKLPMTGDALGFPLRSWVGIDRF